MQQSVLRNITLSLFLGAGLASADTIILASGETLTGEVVEETAEEYTIRVQVGKGIRENRTFKKIDVKKIEKEAPDKKPFEELQGILPIPDLLEKAKYSQVINARLKPFLAKYPKSQHATEVKKMLTQYEEELAKVTDGDVKLNGTWITAADWNANAIENDALIEFNQMEKLANANRIRLAMMQFDKIEENFPGTSAAQQGRELASQILPKLERLVSNKALNAKDNLDKKINALEMLPKRDSRRARIAFDATMDEHKKRIAQARDERNKWLPINDFDEKNLKRLSSHINSTIRKLSRASSKKKNMGEAYREAWKLASAGDAKGLKRALGRLKSSGASQKYRDLLTAQLEANPAPVVVKMEEKESMEKKPMEKKTMEEPMEEKKKKKKKRKASEYDASQDEPEEEESSSLLPIIGGIMGLSLLGILGALFLKKRKGDEDEQ